MTVTKVWEGDQHAVSWEATAEGVPIDLSAASVALVADPWVGGAAVNLPCTVAGAVVTHQLDGELPVGSYNVVVRATVAGKPTTYPDAHATPIALVVRPAAS